MNKLYHYSVLAPLSMPFNILAIISMKISHWIGSIGKPEKTHTYAQYIKHTFNVKDELDKGVIEKWVAIAEARFYKLLEEEREQHNLLIKEYEDKIKELEGDRAG